MHIKPGMAGILAALAAYSVCFAAADSGGGPSDARSAAPGQAAAGAPAAGQAKPLPRPPSQADGKDVAQASRRNSIAGLLREELARHGVVDIDIVVSGDKPYLLVAFYLRGDYRKVRDLFYLDGETPGYMGVAIRPLVPAELPGI